jgi:hypothetical protein
MFITSQRKEKIMKKLLRWLVVITVGTTMFWSIWYLVSGSVPMSAPIPIVSKLGIRAPSLSRWWDIPGAAIIILCAAIASRLANKPGKIYRLYEESETNPLEVRLCGAEERMITDFSFFTMGKAVIWGAICAFFAFMNLGLMVGMAVGLLVVISVSHFIADDFRSDKEPRILLCDIFISVVTIHAVVFALAIAIIILVYGFYAGLAPTAVALLPFFFFLWLDLRLLMVDEEKARRDTETEEDRKRQSDRSEWEDGTWRGHNREYYEIDNRKAFVSLLLSCIAIGLLFPVSDGVFDGPKPQPPDLVICQDRDDSSRDVDPSFLHSVIAESETPAKEENDGQLRCLLIFADGKGKIAGRTVDQWNKDRNYLTGNLKYLHTSYGYAVYRKH